MSDGISQVHCHVRIHGLKSRPELNGQHAIVVTVSKAETTNFQDGGRIQVTTLLSNESLWARPSNLEPAAYDSIVYSTESIVVANVPGRGYGIRAQRDFDKGARILCETPFLIIEMMQHMKDADIVALMPQMAPYMDVDGFPPGLMDIVDQITKRVAELELVRVSERVRKQWMALHDAHSMPPVKTAGNIMRTNSFSEGNPPRGVLFELISRMNHSCDPNVGKRFDGTQAEIYALGTIRKGEELTLNYMPSEAHKPLDIRREMLRVKYNFMCNCARCEPAAEPSQHSRKHQLSVDEVELPYCTTNCR